MRYALRDVAVGPAWFPTLVFALHVFGCKVLDAYENFPWLDIPAHLIGGFAMGYFLDRTLTIFEHRSLAPRTTPWFRITLLAACLCSVTVFWEFAEYASDHTIGTNTQQGLEDTLLDMLLGIVGGATFFLSPLSGARKAQAS